MLQKLTPWEPQARLSNCIEIDDLSISFMRTIRVPDDQSLNLPPPSLGMFPLFKADDFGGRLPASLAEKGGIFIPMYQCEGMYISFESAKRYAVKIFAGNVNVITGKPRVPDAASAQRLQQLPPRRRSIQDYVVVPPQTRVDGVSTNFREARQFVAMPAGRGHSVDRAALLQFEVTRLDSHEVEERAINITVKSLNGEVWQMKISNHTSIRDIKWKISDTIPTHKQRMFYGGEILEDGLLLSDYGVGEGSTLHRVLVFSCVHQLCGGDRPCLPPKCQTAPKPDTGEDEMGFPLGGVIHQKIVDIPKRLFQESSTISFNVQILNSASFAAVTGRDLPRTSVSEASYERLGVPFCDDYKEPSRVSGGFPGLNPMAQLDRTPEEALENLSIIDVETGASVDGCENDEGKSDNIPGHCSAEKPHGI